MIEYTVKVNSDGDKSWWLNDQLHREDGPAIEEADGTKEWYLNGKRHREDGPAVACANGYKAWYLNGTRHRVDGPAIEYASGNKEWWLNGKEISELEFLKQTQPAKEMTVAEIEAALGHAVKVIK